MTEPFKVLALVPYRGDSAPGQRFRIEQWARHWPADRVRLTMMPFETERLRQIMYRPGFFGQKAFEVSKGILRRIAAIVSDSPGHDVAYVYRELMPLGSAILERLLAVRRLPIVFDFDDAIFLPAASEPNRPFQWLKRPAKIRDICALSDLVMVGNDFLAEYARRFAREVRVVPTTIDTDRYHPKERTAILGKPIVGWSGSATTIPHLLSAAPVFRELRHVLDFRLKVVGSTDFAVADVDCVSEGWDPRTEADQVRSFDIGIMPLPDDDWSRGKCGFKVLLYMALGVPAVASAVGVNREIIRDGENGFLASSSREWVEKVSLLARDEDLRRRFAREGRNTVEERYCARLQAPQVLDLLRGAAGSPFKCVGYTP